MSQTDLENWLARILSKDALTFENAYWGDRPPANETIPRIIQELNAVSDSYTKGKLLELLGECGDESVLPILQKEIESSDASIRDWAQDSVDALKRGEPWQRHPKYL